MHNMSLTSLDNHIAVVSGMPGVLVGVPGYALGTFLGTLIYKYWGLII